MTVAQFYDLQKQKKEKEEKELAPLKKAINEYVGLEYEELLDFFVRFDRNRLINYFRHEINKEGGKQ